MPELPEVETIKRELKPRIINQKIIGCRILRKDIIGHPTPKKFSQLIINETILDVQRRAKYLILVLSSEKKLIFHLRLSGKIFIFDAKQALPLQGSNHKFQMSNVKCQMKNGKISTYLKTKNERGEKLRFVRLIIKLENKWLIFSEPRALGRVYLIKKSERPNVLKGFFRLSHEPLSPEYDFQYFSNKIRNRKAKIKSVLLDQCMCAGVGNIYSDEALFHAGIKPTRKANTLETDEIFKLLMAMKQVLRKGIDEFGTTVSDYKRTDGKSGNFQKFLHVYDREGQPCRICGNTIVLTRIGNRSTRYCPKCQK
ncbi:MAG: bifunctional DNA-formamidopyrimidine glycosylase/DNA-(apurinic or apyrimidinic site) lyase [candidate division WOR-3 bacterium]